MSVKEGKELAAKFRSISKKATNEVEETLIKGGLKIERDYKQNVTDAGLVDTGRWRASIFSRLNDAGTNNPNVEVGPGVVDPPYPKMHEFGTSKFPATPTLFPAYNKNKLAIVYEIKKAMQKALKG